MGVGIDSMIGAFSSLGYEKSFDVAPWFSLYGEGRYGQRGWGVTSGLRLRF